MRRVILPVRALLLSLLLVAGGAGGAEPRHDLVILGGHVVDGSGAPPRLGDVAIDGDRVTLIGDLDPEDGRRIIDATGLVITPGFVNMLSWAPTALLVDGRSQGDIRQGVTLEVFGEGRSPGPLNEAMRARLLERQDELRYEIPWTTFGEALEHLEAKGVSTNVASFVGATSVRVHEIGYADRAPTPEELTRMRALVRDAMEDGALGVGSSLIYAPAFYADTDELIALAEVAGDHGGMYISHMRSEGDRLLEAIDELVSVARGAGVPAEIYHLKVSGQRNWEKMDAVIERIEAVRAEGLRITADMYLYTAGSTGLDAGMPPWVQEGGYDAWAGRLQDPEIRARVKAEMTAQETDWENLLGAAGGEGTLLVGFRNPELRRYQGMTLAAVAAERGTDLQDTAMDLVVEDGSRVQVVYFLMSEENVQRQIALPWMSFASDASSMTAEAPFTNRSTHPRAYGNFARLLGRYVRDEGVVSLEEAVRRLTSLPATNLGLRDRGLLAPGYFADVVILDPATIADVATYEDPHRYATGVRDVLVNGVPVLLDGEHTGATPGRFVRGPGWSGWREAAIPGP